jgi:hypothetical protein
VRALSAPLLIVLGLLLIALLLPSKRDTSFGAWWGTCPLPDDFLCPDRAGPSVRRGDYSVRFVTAAWRALSGPVRTGSAANASGRDRETSPIPQMRSSGILPGRSTGRCPSLQRRKLGSGVTTAVGVTAKRRTLICFMRRGDRRPRSACSVRGSSRRIMTMRLPMAMMSRSG